MYHYDSLIFGCVVAIASVYATVTIVYDRVNATVKTAPATPNPGHVGCNTQPIGKPFKEKPSKPFKEKSSKPFKKKPSKPFKEKSSKSTDPPGLFELCDEVYFNRKKDTAGTRRKDEKIATARANLEGMTFERQASSLLELNTWTKDNEEAWRKLKRWVDMVDGCNRAQMLKEELASFVGCNDVWSKNFGQDETEKEAEFSRKVVQEFNDACKELRKRKRWRDRRGLGRD